MKVELLLEGVSVVLLMMVLLVVGCTVEVIDTNEVVDEVFDEVNVVELIATAKVVDDTDKVDIINGRDIIDEVVNTVDVSDTDDE